MAVTCWQWVRFLPYHTYALAILAIMSACALARSEGLADGKQIYAERCASCHGANLEGQPHWKVRLPSGRLPAPPHDASGHTWHHSDAQLFRITKEGPGAIVPGYQTDMPGFAGVLSDAEIIAVLDYIKSTWPAHEQDVQKSR